MNDRAVGVLIGRTGDLTQFVPEQTAPKLRQLEAVAAEAAALRDWELLDVAVEFQVAEQVRFIQWWTAVVSVRESPGTNQWSITDPLSTDAETVGKATGISAMRVSRWRKSLGINAEDKAATPDPEKRALYAARINNAARKEAGWDDNHLAFSEGNDEWSTPQEWIDLARATMGGIELDPATNAGAQSRVQADRFFTVTDDGLDQQWEAETLWLNPPYARAKIVPFVQKLLDAVGGGRVKQSITLVNAGTSSDWFQRLMRAADAFCLPAQRIRFLNPDGTPAEGSPPIGQAFFYFGPNWEAFFGQFDGKGGIASRLGPRLGE